MISPSPTQPPPIETPAPRPEEKIVPAASHQRRLGETRSALTIKAILRPFIKGVYYLSTWIRKHKLSSLAIILLLATSISATTYYLTNELPFGIGQDPFKFSYKGGKGEGGLVQSWLYALRDGETTQLHLLSKDMSQPLDPTQLVGQFSQTKANVTWGDTNVIGVHQEPDMTIDSFVQVTISTSAPGSESKGVMLWHFVTASSANGRELLLTADLVSVRPLLA